jgi:hypothetical protein
MMLRRCDVIRANSYFVGKDFPFSLSYDFHSRMTKLVECGEGNLDACTATDEGEGVAICLNQETEVHGTGIPRVGALWVVRIPAHRTLRKTTRTGRATEVPTVMYHVDHARLQKRQHSMGASLSQKGRHGR